MVPKLKINLSELRAAVQEEYAEVAAYPTKGFHFHTGRVLAHKLGYPEIVETLPDIVVESFAGVGNPFAFGVLEPGATVLDLGSGAGLDSILAAKQVGPTGRVIGVDMTPAMLEKARVNAQRVGLPNVEFRPGYAEALPVDAEAIDVVISNGVINLCPDKRAVFRELFRVLKPGGRLQFADITVARAVPSDAKEDISLWTGWIAGALLEAEMRQIIDEVGFVGVESGPVRYDAFSGAPSESSAAEFGTEGITVRAWKPPATLAKLRSSLNSTPFVASTTVESRARTPSTRASLLRRQPTKTGKYPARLPDEARTLMAESNPLPRANAVLDAPGQGCATLTPLIRARIREMDSGGILEVRTDDPTAIDNLQAWSRLTGNDLVAVSVDDPENQRFFIRKK